MEKMEKIYISNFTKLRIERTIKYLTLDHRVICNVAKISLILRIIKNYTLEMGNEMSVMSAFNERTSKFVP